MERSISQVVRSPSLGPAWPFESQLHRVGAVWLGRALTAPDLCSLSVRSVAASLKCADACEALGTAFGT